MKLVAKVRFIHEKNVQHLVRSFFQEFDPRSSITIKGEVAELEIYFEKLPMEIVDSITLCGVIEFICAPHLWQDEEKQGKEATTEVTQQTEVEEATTEVTQQEETVELTTEESEQAEIESEISEEPESAKTVEIASEEPNLGKKQNSKKSKQSKEKSCEIPKIAELAEKSESYEAFVENVAIWLDLGSNHQFFLDLVENVTLPSKGMLHWKECKQALSEAGKEYSDWKKKKTACTLKVAAKFKESENDVTILKLLETVIGYRTFNFQNETVEVIQTVETAQETTIMSDIPCFKEAVEKVDKRLSIEARVTNVLVAMGVEKLSGKDQRAIWEIANAAVKSNSMDLEVILSKTEIPKEDAFNARMTFSTFINDVVKEHVPEGKIKLIDFLKALQKGIMLETEIE